MKIIIGSESFAPNISGVAVAAELLAKNLTKDGHKVWVFAPSQDFRNYHEKSSDGYTVVRLKSIKNPFRKGFKVTFLPKKEIFREVKKIKPDIVHLQDPTSICSQLLKIAKRLSIPVIATNHFSLDYITSYLKLLRPFHPQIRFILKNYLAKFYNQCDQVLCPTETVKKYLLNWGVNAPIEAISNGVDLDRFFSYSDLTDVKFKYHLPNNPIVLYAGRIDKDKKIEVLINAIPLVAESFPKAHFVIAGQGDLDTPMKKLAEKLEVQKYITWVGWIDKDSSDLEMIYQAASVFAIPSEIETQSIVTLEAMAAGLPIVGANSGALPELIISGKNGFLFDCGESADLAKKIVIILKNEKVRKSMSKQSLEFVVDHEISKSYEKTQRIYSQILAKN